MQRLTKDSDSLMKEEPPNRGGIPEHTLHAVGRAPTTRHTERDDSDRLWKRPTSGGPAGRLAAWLIRDPGCDQAKNARWCSGIIQKHPNSRTAKVFNSCAVGSERALFSEERHVVAQFGDRRVRQSSRIRGSHR